MGLDSEAVFVPRTDVAQSSTKAEESEDVSAPRGEISTPSESSSDDLAAGASNAPRASESRDADHALNLPVPDSDFSAVLP